MPKYRARRVLLWQWIVKNRKRRLALHTAQRTVYRRPPLLLQVTCLTMLLLGNNNWTTVSWAAVWATVMSCGLDVSNDFRSRSRNCPCTAHARQGGIAFGRWGSIFVFLWRLPCPHLNQLFCNLHNLWIEFSECLEWRLLKRQTTAASSDSASRTYARVEPLNLSRT